MNTTTETAPITEENTLPSIDTASLGDITGGCAACGQTCANGPAPLAAGGANKAGLLAAAFSAFSRR